MRHISSILILIMIVALDQTSKTYMLAQSIHPIQVNKFLNLVYVWNEGISFGMFSGRYSNIIFTIITGIISLILTYLLLKTSVQIMKIIYILILGGALGNLIDRIKYGAVFDFIDLHIADFHWPAFNIADSSVCLGGAILIWNIIFNKKL
ncbi:MAG: signal peptidase II [Rickettsiales bacterium]|nr:signal peptidase II [Rickettsiales bacterium]